jgi:hypothetical protein
MLRNISGPTRDEVTEGLRRLHDENLQSFYLLSLCYYAVQIKQNEMSVACSMCGRDDIRIQKFTWATTQQKRSLQSPR